MNTRCLYITGISAIKLMRAARAGEIVSATPAEVTHVEALDPSIASLGDLQIDTLLDWLNISKDNPLEVLAPSSFRRRWFNNFIARIMPNEVPSGFFLELHEGKNAGSRLSLPSDLRIFITGPALCLKYMSNYLAKIVNAHNMSRQEMVLRLIEFACECCGTYARDPLEPRTGDCHYDPPDHDGRFTNLEALTSDVSKLEGLSGYKSIRVALQYVFDRLASPSETYVNLALALPPRLGGLNMIRPLVNEQLVADDSVRSLLRHKSLRPDMQWPDYRMLIEYLGDKEHDGKARRIEDNNRLLDYEEAHYLPLFLMYHQVHNQEALNRTAEMLARAFEERGKKDEFRRLKRLLKNEGFRAPAHTHKDVPTTRYEVRKVL